MIVYGVMTVCALVVVFADQQVPRKMRPIPVFRDSPPAGLTLPNNATAIRENIVDTFSCENRIYGYYADVDNDCQIFHVCMPQNRGAIRWSFICPESTVFNQATFVCTWENDSIPCEESEQYYGLNEEFGKEEPQEPEGTENPQSPEEATYNPEEYPPNNEVPVTPFYGNTRGRGKKNRGGKSYSSEGTTKFPSSTENNDE
ncbi:uncharacterized protein [Fopius arisanus]|uniref:Chitin-binding type-2 domain-containing protein n=1 Tax=Fopius arisanus TaxID=64838 RepID=A0A9R1TXQ6_9HYME|nr:PREDICTED: uncharacterized protein LOC105265734 [Fopius arisanus]